MTSGWTTAIHTNLRVDYQYILSNHLWQNSGRNWPKKTNKATAAATASTIIFIAPAAPFSIPHQKLGERVRAQNRVAGRLCQNLARSRVVLAFVEQLRVETVIPELDRPTQNHQAPNLQGLRKISKAPKNVNLNNPEKESGNSDFWENICFSSLDSYHTTLKWERKLNKV